LEHPLRPFGVDFVDLERDAGEVRAGRFGALVGEEDDGVEPMAVIIKPVQSQAMPASPFTIWR